MSRYYLIETAIDGEILLDECYAGEWSGHAYITRGPGPDDFTPHRSELLAYDWLRLHPGKALSISAEGKLVVPEDRPRAYREYEIGGYTRYRVTALGYCVELPDKVARAAIHSYREAGKCGSPFCGRFEDLRVDGTTYAVEVQLMLAEPSLTGVSPSDVVDTHGNDLDPQSATNDDKLLHPVYDAWELVAAIGEYEAGPRTEAADKVVAAVRALLLEA